MPIYSHSRLSTFESCPLKFKYQYLDKLEPDFTQGIEAFMGGMVHQVLEKLYKDIKFQKIPSVEELLEFFEKLWQENFSETVYIVRKEYSAEDYKKIGEKCIKDFYDSHHPFDGSKVIALEPRIVIDLDGTGKYVLQGYIDRLATNGTIYEIHDYKTSATLPTQEYLEADRQLALYSMYVKKQYQDAKDIKLIWHFLTFDKDFYVEKTDEEVEELRLKIIELIKEIESTKEFEPKVSALCDWCGFQSHCPKRKHLVEIKDLPRNEFLGNNEVQLVKKYTELKEKESVLNREIEKLKDAIYSACKEKGYDTLFGDGQKLTCKEYRNFKFPYKNEPKRQELEIVLKDLGLFDQVSDVDVFKLGKMYNDFEPGIKDILKNFGEEKITRRIYSSKFNK